MPPKASLTIAGATRRRGPHAAIFPILAAAVIVASSVAAPAQPVRESAGDPSAPRAEAPAERFAQRLVDAAIERTRHTVVYDGSYRSIDYPNGDVPLSVGVCTDLIIRAYRAVGVDLQVDTHEEMAAHFDAFPKRWGLTRPDRNIDHRRVPNLQTLFSRRGTSLSVTGLAADYRPGDLVTWTLPGGLPHIGLVTDRRSEDGERPLVAHNIGAGPELEDVLFAYPISGHYRYSGAR